MFNFFVIINIIYLESKLILQVINLLITLQAIRFLKDILIKII
jgi:hypothetical protein